MSNFIHFLNGKFVNEKELYIPPRDLGFSRGYAVHDFIVTYNNRLFKLSEHLDRLFKSAETINLSIPWTKEQIASWAEETINKNDKLLEKTLRIYLTGGISTSMRKSDNPTLLILVSERQRYPENVYTNGIKARTVQYKRPYPKVKTSFYLEAVKELSKEGNSDISEVIYYDDSQVYEGSGASLFAVFGNKLVTAKSNVVEGITRRIVLDEINHSIQLEIRDFNVDEFLTASEVFLTGSNSEIRGVVEIDGKKIGDGKVGIVTKDTIKKYRNYVTKLTGKKF